MDFIVACEATHIYSGTSPDGPDKTREVGTPYAIVDFLDLDHIGPFVAKVIDVIDSLGADIFEVIEQADFAAGSWPSQSYSGYGTPQSTLPVRAEAGLEPNVTKGFKVSNDLLFEEKVTEIVGLYLDPPDRAVVLCVDEKSQIQALDRTQPGLPLNCPHCASN